jgi:ABC-type molybdenum transport system ATPase subunit/photorepair protein PhrA
MTYSTITSQTPENNKSNKNNIKNQNQIRLQQQQSSSHTQNQLPPRDRATKQRTEIPSSNFKSRQRQSFNNNNRNITRNLPSETNVLPKQQQPSPISDDWIEVKSKKTKKFDRVLNDNSSEKFILDEQIPKSLSPPLSLTSTGDNTTATFTSEDDFDEKDNHDLVIIMNNDLSNDCNQIIIHDIHRRLDNNERLLIIMRGCPGSGKSTLAKSLNHGYNGVILSADDYFTDNNLNSYIFDPNKLDDAHR